MTRLGRLVTLFVAATLAGTGAAAAQGRGASNWTTTSGDAQHSAAVRNDPRISKDSLQHPGFQLLWKTRLDNTAKGLDALTQPLLLANIISYQGFKALAFVGGSSNNVYSIDYDLNRMFWKTHFPVAPGGAAGNAECSAGLTAIARPTPLASAPPVGGGRGGGGGVNIGDAVFAIASDGMVHALNVQTGEDLIPPARFLPAGAEVAGAVSINGVLYASTTGSCGGAANGIWSIDLANVARTTASWTSNGGGLVGSTGPTFGANSTIYAATTDGAYSTTSYSDAVVVLDSKTLTLKDWFTPGKTPFTTAPVLFQYKNKDYIVAANSDGRLYLLDSASLGGANHGVPLAKTAAYVSDASDIVTGGLATWQDADGTRWVMASAAGPLRTDAPFPATNGTVSNGAIVAFKLVDANGALSLQPAWASGDMTSPVTPMVMNGVVFAVASGEYREGAANMSVAERAERSTPAVLYALDATTGKALWNSGNAIASFVPGVGPSGGDGQVYVVTYDNTVYAFGMPVEH